MCVTFPFQSDNQDGKQHTQRNKEIHTSTHKTPTHTRARKRVRAMTDCVHTSIRIASMPAPCGACNSLSWSKNQLCFWC